MNFSVEVIPPKVFFFPGNCNAVGVPSFRECSHYCKKRGKKSSICVTHFTEPATQKPVATKGTHTMRKRKHKKFDKELRKEPMSESATSAI